MTAVVALDRVTKRFATRAGTVEVLRNVSLAIPAGMSIAVLGRNGAGKSTLLKMIAGTLPPDTGRILRRGRVSWPVGFAGSFHPDLTGRQNLRFAARLYGVDRRGLEDLVEEFCRLGPQLDAPIRTYSSGMRARLAFGLSLGMPFDLYLVDEVIAVGDAAFRQRSEALLRTRLGTAGALVVSHSIPQLRTLCTAGIVLTDAMLTWHDSLEDAVARYTAVAMTPETAQSS